jgi:hypothetical protein
MKWKSTLAMATIAGSFCVAGDACAQQANISSPFNNVGSGFYENIGTSWGLRGPGWFFNFGGGNPNPANPGFGGVDPGAGANFGAGFRAGNTTGFFNLTAGQGANSTFVSQTPNVTIPNGGNGYFIDGSFRPFVTSIMPIVGDPSDPSPLRERLRRLREGEVASPSPGDESAQASGGGGTASGGPSTAERGDLSVAAIKAQAAAAGQAEDTELAVILEKAKGAEAAGKTNVARIYYQMAARRARGEQQREILKHLETLPK